MDVKKCELCGKEFEPNRSYQVYCSKKCQHKKSHQYSAMYKQACKEKKNKEKLAGKKKENALSLTAINTAAREAGMNYGEYVARMGL